MQFTNAKPTTCSLPDYACEGGCLILFIAQGDEFQGGPSADHQNSDALK